MAEPGRLNAPILLTGAAGFIGGAVLEGLRRLPERPLRLLVHRRLPSGPLPAGSETVAADLGRPETLLKICGGVGTVIHAASHIGPERECLEAVNAGGTEALVAQARAAGVRRFIYVSSAAVYGYAVHRGATEAEAKVRPATAVSRSRLLAERAVLGSGGLVLRPLFVYGRGDTRFLPVLIKTMEKFPFLIDGGRARLSVISVDDLARAIVALATEEGSGPLQGIYHANDGRPVSLKEIVDTLAGGLGLSPPGQSLPLFLASPMLRWAGRKTLQRSGRDSFKHRLFLISRDHYYDSGRLWARVSSRPGPPFAEQFASYADWYRGFVTARPAGGRP
jgi:2-alkyl-3-oxoalkanoate reductase